MADKANADPPAKTEDPLLADAPKASQAELASDPEEDDLDELDGKSHTTCYQLRPTPSCLEHFSKSQR